MPTKFPIVLASDHAGYQLKEQLSAWLAKAGYAVHDCTPTYRRDDDYPGQAAAASRAVERIPQAKVVLVCGSGAGIAMAANRFPWMRVVQATDPAVIKMARADEDANGLALSSRQLNLSAAVKLVQVFLKVKSSVASRHRRRQRQLTKLP
jgi:RpiB/LacA/LacB family sugar-phosphate isomerase